MHTIRAPQKKQHKKRHKKNTTSQITHTLINIKLYIIYIIRLLNIAIPCGFQDFFIHNFLATPTVKKIISFHKKNQSTQITTSTTTYHSTSTQPHQQNSADQATNKTPYTHNNTHPAPKPNNTTNNYT